MRKIFLVAFWTVWCSSWLSTTAHAQSTFISRFGQVVNSGPIGLGTAAGDLYVAGNYNLVPNTSQFSHVRVARVGTTSGIYWEKILGSTGSDFGRAMSTDAAGNCWVSGTFGGPVTAGSVTVPAGIFVLKLDATGAVLWDRHPSAAPNLLATSPGGATAGAGRFVGSFSAGAVSLPADADPELDNGFVVNYDAAGTAQWALRLSGGGLNLRRLHTDSDGNIYVVGDFDPTLTVAGNTYSAADGNNFVLQLSPAGAVNWVRQYPFEVTDVVAGAGGALYLSGSFSGNIVLGGVALTSTRPNGVLAQLNAAGTAVWARVLDPNQDPARNSAGPGALAVDVAGNVYMTGFLSGVTDLGETRLTAAPIPSVSQVYVASFRPGGGLRWVRTGTGSGLNISFIQADGTDAAFIAGRFYGTNNFQARPIFGPVSSNGSSSFSIDTYYARLRNTPTISSLSPGSGPAGTAVLINGQAFGAAPAVAFNGLAATPATVNAAGTEITTAAPANVSAGYVTVSTVEGLGVSPVPFTTGPTTWAGTVSTDWFDAANWSGGVPSASLSAVVPAGTPYAPVIGSGTASVQDLTLNGATLTISGGTLDIVGVFTNNGGTLRQTGGGGVAFTGTTPQVLGGSGGTVELTSLTVGPAGATLSGPVQVEQVLTLQGNLVSNGNLVLLSDAEGQAMVIPTGTGVIIGAVTVQHFVGAGTGSRTAAAGRAASPTELFYHLSSPVAGATVGQLTTLGYAAVVNPCFNSITRLRDLTGPTPTVLSYADAAAATAFWRGWQSPGSLAAVLPAGAGYGLQLTGSPTFALQGTLNTGTISSPPLTRSAQNSGWNLVGNPYPSLLDWRVVAPTLPAGVGRALYVYDEQAGAFRYYVNGIGNPLTDVMQGFFVRVVGPVGSPAVAFSFTDAARTASVPRASAFVPTADARPLVQLAVSTATGETDRTTVYFDAGATAAAEASADAWKIPADAVFPITSTTPKPVLGSWAGSDLLAVNGLPALGSATVSVPLSLEIARPAQCTIGATLRNVPPGTAVLLLDRVANRSYDLRQAAGYTFQGNNGNLDRRFTLQLVPAASRVASANPVAHVYPQPAHEAVSVLLPAELAQAKQVRLQLLDAFGRVVLDRVASNTGAGTPMVLPVLGKPAGVYTLRLSSAGTVVSQRVLVE
ncbi:T9SS type A sorting domain-containing protein [Hymenobacter busanensis]|uniref:T9SS type A sorting domain-containing protein n=1 Tax=Hymenobacter busanensis TaxID=2607656 RepID=A0A7L4ZWW9_9BACT|nr:T9SS type A sorting domain-containing protein [Hymenobacter busanensis]KAA9333322.1 T9SS type A sorting domain-containing protein [Hymenobacter busanensis]QHJ07999.1 T9SS type A sorting domain-containing protein [Hymenobacter busanensis]